MSLNSTIDSSSKFLFSWIHQVSIQTYDAQRMIIQSQSFPILEPLFL